MAWTSITTPTTGTAISVTSFGAPVVANFVVLSGARTSYTPTTTGITLGNGTVTGRYRQVDKEVEFICQFTFGSTSAVTASPTFTLPATALTTGWTAAQ